jgi:hypothetical protein
MESLLKESRIILTFKALKKKPKISIRKATTIYETPEISFRRRYTRK